MSLFRHLWWGCFGEPPQVRAFRHMLHRVYTHHDGATEADILAAYRACSLREREYIRWIWPTMSKANDKMPVP